VAQPLFDAAPAWACHVRRCARPRRVAAINAIPMRPTPRQKVFNAGDLPAFGLYAQASRCFASS
jgi:hypothetical protein